MKFKKKRNEIELSLGQPFTPCNLVNCLVKKRRGGELPVSINVCVFGRKCLKGRFLDSSVLCSHMVYCITTISTLVFHLN